MLDVFSSLERYKISSIKVIDCVAESPNNFNSSSFSSSSVSWLTSLASFSILEMGDLKSWANKLLSEVLYKMSFLYF
jgi:hypothetical protein